MNKTTNLDQHFALQHQYKEIARISRYEVSCKSQMTASTIIIKQNILSPGYNAVQTQPVMLEGHITSTFQVKAQAAKDNSLNLLGFQPGIISELSS
jgi:hypothetical protein